MSEQTKAPLAGEIVCVSGKFEGYTQEEMTSLVESNGATCVSSVTKKTTMLVTGDKVGATKLTKAQELGIKIVPQEEFFKMVSGGGQTEPQSQAELPPMQADKKDSTGEPFSMELRLCFESGGALGIYHVDDELKAMIEEYNTIEDDDRKEELEEEIKESLDDCGPDDFYNTELDVDDVADLYDPEAKKHYEWKANKQSGDKTVDLTPQEHTYAYRSSFGRGGVISLRVRGNGDFDPSKLVLVQRNHLIDGSEFEITEFYYDSELCSYDVIDGAEEKWADWTFCGQALEGETVCVSGKFEGLSQEAMTELVEKNGGTCVSSVTKKTTMLVTGDKVGATKLTKAQELGVRIVPQEEFFQMVHGLEGIDTEKKTASLEVEILPSGEGCVCVGIADKKATNIEIPSTMEIEGKVYKVMEIGECAFLECENLKSVTIPDSVTVIGKSAFCRCSSLTSVNLPNTVVKIGGGSFWGCSSLTSVDIPGSVTEIGERLFSDCTSLTSVTIPDSLTKIGERMFSDCTSLTSVIIPKTVTEIGKCAFLGCSSLTSVTIPDSVTEIGESAFYGCKQLTSVTIPDSVTGIGENAFSNCPLPPGLLLYANGTQCYGWIGNRSQCISVIIPDSVTQICKNSFSSCSSLASVTIPETVTQIKENAFSGCKKLKSVIIPDSVEKIGDGSFSGCSFLASVSISESIAEIGKEVFAWCSSLMSVTVPDSVTKIGEGSFSGCSSLKSMSIPGSVTMIGERAFSGCSSLTSVTIPESVTQIGNYAFSGCYLKTVKISKNSNLDLSVFGKGVEIIRE